MKKTISWYKIKISVLINVVLLRVSLLGFWGWMIVSALNGQSWGAEPNRCGFSMATHCTLKGQGWVAWIPASSGPHVCHICSSITQTNPTCQREEENKNLKFVIYRLFPLCVLTAENNRFHSDTSRYVYNVIFFHHIQPVSYILRHSSLCLVGAMMGKRHSAQ